jgi:NAD dependent epimerase/dehydratase family enzyme
VLKLLFGEMASILLEGSRASSEKITDTGFKFKFKTLNDALNNLLN